MKTISLQKFFNDAQAIIKKYKFAIKDYRLNVSFSCDSKTYGDKLLSTKPRVRFSVSYDHTDYLTNSKRYSGYGEETSVALAGFVEEIKRAKGIQEVKKLPTPDQLVTIQ
jgi:hypothetical protein